MGLALIFVDTQVYSTMDTDTLNDTGGHYYDRAKTGVIGTIERNAQAAKGELTSGNAGQLIVATVAGSVLTFLLKGAMSNE